MKTYVIALLLFATATWAQTLRVHRNDEGTAIEVRREGRAFFRYERPLGFHDQVLWEELPFILMTPEEGQLPGPFLSTVWRKGGRDSKAVLTFDLSRAGPGVDPKDLIVHSYISAHGVDILPGKREFRIVGESDLVDERAMEYRKEVVVCPWHYRPGTRALDCRGPTLQ